MAGKGETRKRIKELIEQIDETYFGDEERAMIDQALALCREIGDEELEYRVRIRLTTSAGRTGDNDALLSSFAWCLAKHDADPRKFPNDIGDDMADLMWQFKWIVGTLDASPIFSLAQSEAVLDDMEAHYRREGLGLSGVLNARFGHAWATGDMLKAKELRTQLMAEARDDHSHCDACSRSEFADFALEIDEDELALKLVDEIIEGGFSCGSEPERALSRTLVARLRAGQMEEAREAHMRSYRLARRNPDNINIVADNILFCAITGNEARGLAMVERHLPWIAHDSLNEGGQRNMLRAIGVTLEAVKRAGHGDQIVRGADSPALERFFGAHDGPWTVADLVVAVDAATDRLAAAFDARNGNAYVSSLIAKSRALLDESYDLPIITEVFLPPAPASFQPSTPADYLELAELYSYAGVPEAAVTAATAVLDGGDPTQRARALQFLIWAWIELGNLDEATELLPARFQALAEEGRTDQAEVEGRLGLTMFGRNSPESEAALRAEMVRLMPTLGEVLADVELTLASVLSAKEDPSDQPEIMALLNNAVAHSQTRPSLHVSALRWIMITHAQQGRLDEAIQMAEHILTQEISEGGRASVLVTRARILGGMEKFDQGAADADEASKTYAAYGMTEAVITSTMLASALLHDGERYDEELSRLRYALRLAEQMERPTTGIRFRLGTALLSTGHHQEAIEILWEVLGDEEELEASPSDLGETCHALAQAFEADERYANAVAMYKQAAEHCEEADEPVNAAELLRRAANILRGFEVYDDSLEFLARAWDLLQGQEVPALEVEVLEAWAYTKAGVKNASAVEDIDKAIAMIVEAPEGPFTWKIGDLTDSKARVMVSLEHHQEAVALFLQAADLYAQAEDINSAARAEHFAAQTLAGPLTQGKEAIPLWRAALNRLDTAEIEIDPSLRNSILVKLAEGLEEQGDQTEAASVRALITE
ncbi:MAG: hypothetical protein FWD55_08290 [Propionibacteriaceae bacterium]|nr:hypothetical protein [Propionibacteriaceae bacterium]